ncbi:MAG: hypothetical protein EKK55_17365 [Rhodocyclaceae bacterium]|nr:MAG: hypothetical protein EKK55_17365 [Rhodocyclaceae bacterium]
MSELENEFTASIEIDTRNFPSLEGAREGTTGKGTFNFKVSGEKGGSVLAIDLISVKLEAENRADKALKTLIGDTITPPTGEPSEAGDSRNDEADIY